MNYPLSKINQSIKIKIKQQKQTIYQHQIIKINSIKNNQQNLILSVSIIKDGIAAAKNSVKLIVPIFNHKFIIKI